jgi:FkbM family methyltransferase
VVNSVAEWTHAIRAAVSDTNEKVSVPNIDPLRSNNVGGARMNDEQNFAGIKTDKQPDLVDTVRIDQFNLKRCDLLKIDVEGMESKVLAGAANTVSRHKPRIFAEALPWEEENLKAMQSFLRAHDYLAWSITSPLYTPDNVRLCEHNIFGDQSDVNLIAVHKDQKPPAITEQLLEFSPDYE